MLKASSFSGDHRSNLQLGLAIELAVLPPYLYALWSIKSREEGASDAALEAAKTIRAVAYEEMLHAGLVSNVLSALGAVPAVTANSMRYPGPLPGHVTTGPHAYDVGLCALSPAAIATFMKIEQPEWDVPTAQSVGGSGEWITVAAFYRALKIQLAQLPIGSFGHCHQLAGTDNPGPGRLNAVVDLASALQAIDTVVDQGEGHEPADPHDVSAENDNDHEVAHYYQFRTIGTYFPDGIDPDRDLYRVIDNPDATKYSPAQQAANTQFNTVYTALLDSVQAVFSVNAPTVFGSPTQLMTRLTQAAAVLRNSGTVPGTSLLAGPTFEYLGTPTGGLA